MDVMTWFVVFFWNVSLQHRTLCMESTVSLPETIQRCLARISVRSCIEGLESDLHNC